MRRLVFLLPLGLLACGPVPVEQAERLCVDRARLAEKPRGEIAVGATSDGRAYGRVELEVSSDYLQGRSPESVFTACVINRSGEAPTRTYEDMKGGRK